MLMDAIKTYLAIRRAAGFVLKCEEFQLKSFAAFSAARGQQYANADVAIEWAGGAPTMAQRARRLGTIIRFARHARAEDPRHQVPSPIFGAETSPRRAPYLLTMDQIRHVIAAASRSGHRTFSRLTYSTLFALLACTGLRVSEAIGLRFDDITPDGLVIRRTKFRKSRLVPLHDTARAGLERYLRQRRPYAPWMITSSSQYEENHCGGRMWTGPSAPRRSTWDCRTGAAAPTPRLIRCAMRSRSERCKPARMGATRSRVTWSRSRPTSVTATSRIRIGIWKPCPI